jgi:hypothetical protein
LSALDYKQPILLSCGVPRHQAGNTNVIAIPVEHRVDGAYAPTGLKLVEDFWRPQPFTNVGEIYTLTIDPSAIAYRVSYFPRLTVLMDDPSEDFDQGEAESSWSFTAEQV